MTTQTQLSEQEKAQRLTALYNYSTSYEKVLTDGNSNTYLLSYGATSRSRLVETLRNLWDEIEQLTGATGWQRAKGCLVSDDGKWTIKLTGRTERDAICEGVWPTIGQ